MSTSQMPPPAPALAFENSSWLPVFRVSATLGLDKSVVNGSFAVRVENQKRVMILAPETGQKERRAKLLRDDPKFENTINGMLGIGQGPHEDSFKSKSEIENAMPYFAEVICQMETRGEYFPMIWDTLEEKDDQGFPILHAMVEGYRNKIKSLNNPHGMNGYAFTRLKASEVFPLSVLLHGVRYTFAHSLARSCLEVEFPSF
ncbi:MAG: hypothetical protein Q9222_002971 [Ikaeria aurantiellina]